MIFIYIPVCHWIWGGGFLAKIGVMDFAGGIVIHVSAGFAALASVIFLGRRDDMKPGEPTVPNNLPLVAVGAGLLWFGWFGFNAAAHTPPTAWPPMPSPTRPSPVPSP